MDMQFAPLKVSDVIKKHEQLLRRIEEVKSAINELSKRAAGTTYYTYVTKFLREHLLILEESAKKIMEAQVSDTEALEEVLKIEPSEANLDHN